MTLAPDWRALLKKAWSIRLALLSGVFGGVEAFLPLFSDSVPRGVFAGLCMLASLGAVISRVILQKGLRDAAE